jgi:alkyl sulfatase BDS1-like metallo-beta-lactamase superfamily hydrolase
MGKIADLAEKLWTGETKEHPWTPLNELEELDRGIAFMSSFANVGAVATDEGLVLIDTGSFLLAKQVHETIRHWTPAALHTAVYTHGHVDHVFGVGPFEAEGKTPRPVVVAHEDLPARFDRYKLTAGWNGCINIRQFQMPGLRWPTQYRYPDVVYRDTTDLDVGGVRFRLFHARGETDDHTWVWLPERRVLFTGDLFIWATPNAGNPQKVQRYPQDWARALRAMMALEPALLLPGHGVPIVGAARVRQALDETATLLEHLHDETVRLMNEGARLDDIVHAVRAPAHLLKRPYLKPVYDEPEFVVRNVYRFYGGWWDGNPAHLKPAPEAAVARELAALAGGAGALAARARALADGGDVALACHLVEFAAQAAPDDAAVRAARADVYDRRAAEVRSVMARGVYRTAAAESRGER